MPSQVFSSGKWTLLLDDASVVSDVVNHCYMPFNAPNGYVCFSKWGQQNGFVARKISTGVEQSVAPASGGAFAFIADARYALMAFRIQQGKQYDALDCGCAIFDTQAQAFLDFAALGLPTLDIHRGVGSGVYVNILWIQNGRQVSGFEGSDPIGKVGTIRFISSTLIEYVLRQQDSSGVATGFLQLRRTLNLTTGAMGAIQQIASHPVNQASPTEPAWL